MKRKPSFRAFVALVSVLGLLEAVPALAGSGGWVTFTDETANRLIADAVVGTGDTAEKDFAVGDVDHDGDLDLVCVRKEPWTTPGRRRNVLYMNEGVAQGHPINGVLVDRTAALASAADDGGQGFLDDTNDRDVILHDINNDGWLDMITAVTLSEGLPKTISHPRIYINRQSVGGVWQGFRYEQNRTPQILSSAGGQMTSGRFCSVAAGDVTGDGFADLYFGDYDQGGSRPFDVNDRLWINDGTGHFTETFNTRMTTQMLHSAFGMAVAIADMNNDGARDIVKDTALSDPRHVSISYNDPNNLGFFDDFEAVYNVSPYHVTVGDLNNDNLPDLVITDDGSDRYMINQGPGADGRADFVQSTFSFQVGGDNGFGGNSAIADLNNDGLRDVIIVGVDVDAPGCGRAMNIYRNLGNLPNVTLQKQGGDVPWSPPGVHDVAVFDLNGDGWKDLVLGTCTGVSVWINDPPVGLVFSYPLGLPAFVTPDQDHTFEVQLTAFGGGAPVPGSAELHLSIDNGPFSTIPLTDLGAHRYGATLPARECTHKYAFYVTAMIDNGTGTFVDPPGGESLPYTVVSADGMQITLREEFEGPTGTWTVVNAPSLTAGGWEPAAPNGTVFGGQLAAPSHDATEALGAEIAFVTGNGPIGAAPTAFDVDGGPTHLISPSINLVGTDAIISYARWFYCNQAGESGADLLTTAVSNDDGETWVTVHTTPGTQHDWQNAQFQVGDYVEPTATVRVRFSTSDQPNTSITEAGIDNFQVMRFVCDIDCGSGGDCLDALFCNGAEQCVDNLCQAGEPPCPGQICDEANDRCAECTGVANCDDGLFCNGAESCEDGVCVAGEAPCGNPGLACDEGRDVCTGCAAGASCDDGSYCNGVEQCVDDACLPAFAGVSNGTFDGAAGWTNNVPTDGTITYNGVLRVEGPNPNAGGTGGASAAWSTQTSVDLKGALLEFTLVSYTSVDELTFDYPVFVLDGTFYGLDADGTLGAPIGAGGTDGAGTINNGSPASNVHFTVDIDALAGPGRHTIGFGVHSVDGGFGAGIAVFDNVLPAQGNAAPCRGDLCSDIVADCVECLVNSHCGGGMFCDGATGSCVACITNSHCDDGNACNGVETCSGGGCVAGTPPVCDDGLFCNGIEVCDAGAGCVSSGSPCGGSTLCDEEADSCDRALQPRPGEPLAGLTAAQLERFYIGRSAFDQHFQAGEGLGPTFNQDSCGACHNDPLGGSGSILVTRFGRVEKGSFDPLEGLGGSLLQAQGISLSCAEVVPAEANVVAQRVTPSTMGFGLVEAILDDDILAGELSPPAGVDGRVHWVEVFETPLVPRVGRFGWKSQMASVLSFSADAALNEMGLTNRFLVEENAPNGDLDLLAICDTVADPEDGPDGEGYHFIDRVTDFQRFLAPPPQTPRSGMSGEALFVAVGCAACHTPSFTTGVVAEDVLSAKVLKPYSDFLLHDMGLLGDGIAQGDAGETEMRTPPLWGVRLRDPLLHDGRVAAGTFTTRMLAVIGWHGTTGSEAAGSVAAFDALNPADQDRLIAFLDSLGRVEFDHEGDSDVDLTDWQTSLACLVDPGSAAYSPDDPCAISDFDQDGDVDLFDVAWLQRAFTGDTP